MSLQRIVASELFQCLQILESERDQLDRVVVVFDSIVHLIESVEFNSSWLDNVAVVLQQLSDLIVNTIEQVPVHAGRPRVCIDLSLVNELFHMGFTVTKISKLLGICRMTLYRRFNDANMTPSRITRVTDEELDEITTGILREFPNSGYRRVQGYLKHKGFVIQQLRIRNSVKRVDPTGVFQRTMASRIIVRRKYFVKHSNHIWHIDTHMKLIRWKICIRGGIDGKSRVITFLHASNDNKAATNLLAFLNGVEEFGLPWRTRSDKGKENTLIARYMVQHRGPNRGSHIVGKSIHNQRIERLWGDVFYAMLVQYYSIFSNMESNGILNVDNAAHIAILHYVFLPRLNDQLREFAGGWNMHPLSTESNSSPNELFVTHMGPLEDHCVDDRNIHEWNTFCNNEREVETVFEDGRDSAFADLHCNFSEEQLQLLSRIDVMRPSADFGVDIYEEAVGVLPQDNYL